MEYCVQMDRASVYPGHGHAAMCSWYRLKHAFSCECTDVSPASAHAKTRAHTLTHARLRGNALRTTRLDTHRPQAATHQPQLKPASAAYSRISSCRSKHIYPNSRPHIRATNMQKKNELSKWAISLVTN
jgi:hypothetical protein